MILKRPGFAGPFCISYEEGWHFAKESLRCNTEVSAHVRIMLTNTRYFCGKDSSFGNSSAI